MGRIGRVISYDTEERGDITVGLILVDLGGGENKTLDFFSANGDDSPPLPGDYVAVLKQPGTGRAIATSYFDPKNTYDSSIGEKRIYGRSPSTGNKISQVWLKDDGSILIESSGDLTLNGVTISSSGDVVIPNSLLLNGKEIDDHRHSQGPDSGTDTEQDTSGNL